MQTMGFNGVLHEAGTCWQLLGNGRRAYNPVLMRFHSPDRLSPFGRGGVNTYAYCRHDPINYIDPDGHFGVWLMLRGILQSTRQAFSRLGAQVVRPFRRASGSGSGVVEGAGVPRLAGPAHGRFVAPDRRSLRPREPFALPRQGGEQQPNGMLDRRGGNAEPAREVPLPLWRADEDVAGGPFLRRIRNFESDSDYGSLATTDSSRRSSVISQDGYDSGLSQGSTRHGERPLVGNGLDHLMLYARGDALRGGLSRSHSIRRRVRRIRET